MSNDITTKLTFKVDDKQLRQATEQLARLQRRLVGMKKAGNSSASAMTKVKDKISQLQVKISKLDGSFVKVAKVIKKAKTNTDALTKAVKKNLQTNAKSTKVNEKLAKSLKNVGDTARKGSKKVKQGSDAIKGAGAESKKTGSSLGFTGLAFGFIGGAAAFAGNQIKSFFIDIVRDGVEDIGAMNRAIVQSGINLENFLGGNTDEFKVVGQRIKDLQRSFEEFSRAEIASAFKEIGRAVGADVGLDDIEKITDTLLTIARIDETGGAGLPKTAVDLKRVMTQFGISADGLDEFLDKLVNTNQQGAIELNQLVSSLGFAGAQTQRFGVAINDTLALTGFIFEKSGRKAGAAGRTFGNILDKLASTSIATNQVLKDMGINILDTAGNFNPFLDIVDDARQAFKRMKEEGKGQIFESALLEEFGFDKTAARGFLALVQTSRAELESLSKGVSLEGTAKQLSASIGEGADIKLKGFENEVRNLKAEFVTGLSPALSEFTDIVREFSQDEGFINTIQEFGRALGTNLVTALRTVTALIKPFADLLRDNAGFADLAAKALIGLVGALTAMGVLFPLLGGLFALQFLHEKLILRFTQLGTEATFVTKIYGTMTLKVQALMASFRGLFVSQVSLDTLNAKSVKSMTGLQKAVLRLTIEVRILKLNLLLLGAQLKANMIGFLKFSKLIFTNPVKAFKVLGLSLKRMRLSFIVFGKQVKAAGIALIGFSKKAVLSVIGSLKTLGGGLKIAGLQFIAFTRLAITAAIAAATAWLVAMGPIIIVIAAVAAALVLTFGIMRLFQDEIVGITDTLDKSGTAGNNFKNNMDGLFDFLETGDFSPFVDAIEADLRDTETRFSAFGNAWNQLVADLKESDIGKGIAELAANTAAWFESLDFSLPGIWTAFNLVLLNISGLFGLAVLNFNKVLSAMGVDVPEFWAKLDKAMTDIKQGFVNFIKPITDFIDKLDFELPPGIVRLIEGIESLSQKWTSFVNNINSNPILGPIAQLFGIFAKAGENAALGSKAVGGRGDKVIPDAESFFALPGGVEGPERESVSGTRPIAGDFLSTGNGIDVGFAAEVQATLQAGKELKEEENKLTEATVELQEEFVELQEAANVNLTTGNPLTKQANLLQKNDNLLTTTGNGFKKINNIIIDNNTDLTKLMNENLNISIVEIIRNFNQVSALTTMIAAAQLMFANLVAQGNRAAGKLASLRVSSKGRFSISDPGVSASDQASINDAESNLLSTRNNQVNITPNINIVINPTINVENGADFDASAAANDINDELTEALQNNAAIVGAQ